MVGCTRATLASALLVVLATSGAPAGECAPARVAPSFVRGEVALTDAPFCAFFVVATSEGFSLLHLERGREVFAEGDRILGPLQTIGHQHVSLPDWQGDVLEVEIEEVGVSLHRAQTAFGDRCADFGPKPRSVATAVTRRVTNAAEPGRAVQGGSR
jgi:hypothetical protein